MVGDCTNGRANVADKKLDLSFPFLLFFLLFQGFAKIHDLGAFWNFSPNNCERVCKDPTYNSGDTCFVWCFMFMSFLMLLVNGCSFLSFKNVIDSYIYIYNIHIANSDYRTSSASWWSPMSFAIKSAFSTSASPSSAWPGRFERKHLRDPAGKSPVFFLKGKFHDFTNWPSFWSDLACWDFSTFFCSGWKCNANLSTFTIICQVTGRCFGNKLSLEFTKQKPSRRKHNALTKHLSKENLDSNPCMNLLAGDGFFLGPLCRTPRLLWF